MSSIYAVRSPNAGSRRGAGRAALVETRARRLAWRAPGAVAATALAGLVLYTALAPDAGSPSPLQRVATPDSVAAPAPESSPSVAGAPSPARAGLLAALRRLLASTPSTSVAFDERPAAERSSDGPPALDRAAAFALPADAGAGGETDRVSRARERARAELELLNVQQPEVFLEAMLAEQDQSFAARRVREATQRYVQRRTELLRQMLTSRLEAPLDYDGSEALSELEELATEFKTSVEDFEEDFPGVAQLPEVFSQTALPLPDFASPAH